ncbi:MAG: glycosyl hydrolase, partial [Trueperaceae bacterium]
DPTALRNAWRHIHAIFQQEGATNVRWVFSPNVTDEPRTTTNRLENYYPGHDVVDILALDGYNWGDTRPHIGWRDFDTIFHTAYRRITQLGQQPIWITEVASAEAGGAKGAWIREMLGTTAFPRLRAIVWFNEDKETDWRLESSQASLQAFRSWFAAGSDASDAVSKDTPPDTVLAVRAADPLTPHR